MRLPFVDISDPEAASDILQIYQDNGFVRIDGVYSECQLEEMRTAMAGIVGAMNVEEHPKSVFTTYDEDKHASDTYFLESADKVRFFYEEDAFDKDGNLQVPKERALNKVGHALHWLDPVFKKCSFSENVKKIIRCLKMVEPEIVQSMYIFKQPNIGGAVTDHIDATFLQVDPIEHVVGVWIAVDDATEENGCLWFIPGSHKVEKVNWRFVRTHTTDPSEPLLKFIGTKTLYDQKAFVPVPVPRGSLVLINGLVAHKSERNLSAKSRHAYTFHVVDKHNTTWNPDNWLQATAGYEFPNVYEN